MKTATRPNGSRVTQLGVTGINEHAHEERTRRHSQRQPRPCVWGRTRTKPLKAGKTLTALHDLHRVTETPPCRVTSNLIYELGGVPWELRLARGERRLAPKRRGRGRSPVAPDGRADGLAAAGGPTASPDTSTRGPHTPAPAAAPDLPPLLPEDGPHTPGPRQQHCRVAAHLGLRLAPRRSKSLEQDTQENRSVAWKQETFAARQKRKSQRC